MDDLPIKNGWIFPWQTVSHDQRVLSTPPFSSWIFQVTLSHPGATNRTAADDL